MRGKEAPHFLAWRTSAVGQKRKVNKHANLLFSLFVYQDILLPFAGFFIGAMNASRPTARKFFAFEKLLCGSPDSPVAGLFLLGIFDPTNEFVPCDWRQAFPETTYFSRLSECTTQVSGKFVHETARNHLCHVGVLTDLFL